MINYAHRGASARAPENTFSAFYLAVELGANGIETDIRRTKDGVLVLLHDQDLVRLAGLDKKVQAMSYAELARIDLGSHKGTRYQNERVVKLADFLRYFAGRPLELALEIKQEGIEAEVLDLVAAYNCASQVTITSFQGSILHKIRQLNKKIRLGFLTEQITSSLLKKLAEKQVNQICPRAAGLTRPDVQAARQLGFSIRAWGVKDEAIMRHAVSCGVDGMTIDFPDKLARYLKDKL